MTAEVDPQSECDLQVEIPEEIVTEVLVVANQLAMNDLVCRCEEIIKDAVDVENGELINP